MSNYHRTSGALHIMHVTTARTSITRFINIKVVGLYICALYFTEPHAA